MMRPAPLIFLGFTLALFSRCINLLQAESPAQTPPLTSAQSLPLPGIHNAYRATEKIYSGSQPEGDAAFAALAQLGVKTIISVDGAKPEVELARKHGLRYIHLPFGYDGVPPQRVAELTKAVTMEAGPFYVHCHHGKHRGPAAVAVMCLANSNWTTNQALTWMQEAGTAPDYPGLYRAALNFQPPAAPMLAAIQVLPETAPVSSLVDAMVAIDLHLEHLKLAQAAGWKTPTNHADISPAHEAILLMEQFREIARLADTARRPLHYRELLTQAEKLSLQLAAQLKSDTPQTARDATLRQIQANCVACHRPFRNE